MFVHSQNHRPKSNSAADVEDARAKSIVLSIQGQIFATVLLFNASNYSLRQYFDDLRCVVRRRRDVDADGDPRRAGQQAPYQVRCSLVVGRLCVRFDCHTKHLNGLAFASANVLPVRIDRSAETAPFGLAANVLVRTLMRATGTRAHHHHLSSFLFLLFRCYCCRLFTCYVILFFFSDISSTGVIGRILATSGVAESIVDVVDEQHVTDLLRGLFEIS